jgi:hypothetical protein
VAAIHARSDVVPARHPFGSVIARFIRAIQGRRTLRVQQKLDHPDKPGDDGSYCERTYSAVIPAKARIQ